MANNNATNSPNDPYNLIVGNGVTYTAIPPSATTGRPLCSQGAAANPAYDAEPVVDKITINDAPVDPTDGTNKAYVDAIAAGFDFKNACYVATTANLTAAYNNGAAGVGATLTNSGALAAFSSDGQSPAINSRILVRQQTNEFENGIYDLTTVGDGATPWVLTRSTDYDTAAEVTPGSIVPVAFGTLYADSLWIQSQTVTTMGTDPIIFIRFDNDNNASYVTDSGTAIPSAGALNVLGTAAQGISTAGSGDTVTLTVADATTSQKGVLPLATAGEAVAGADATKAITSSTLASKLGTQTTKGVPFSAGSTSAVNWTAGLTDGQLVIGSTAGNPAAATLTAGTGISIVNAANGITISAGGTGNGFTSIVVHVFTSGSGTYTPTAGMAYCVVECLGGGGGGGAGNFSTGFAGAGCGGAGGYAKKTFSAATIGASQPYAVGAAGTAGLAGGGPTTGGTGGTSSFGAAGALLSATGGAGGVGNDANHNAGGAGGAGSLGDLNITGQGGGSSFSSGASASGNFGGGSSVYGGGAHGTYLASNNTDGVAATGYGSGGGGYVGTPANRGGGVSSGGLVILTEYVE